MAKIIKVSVNPRLSGSRGPKFSGFCISGMTRKEYYLPQWGHMPIAGRITVPKRIGYANWPDLSPIQELGGTSAPPKPRPLWVGRDKGDPWCYSQKTDTWPVRTASSLCVKRTLDWGSFHLTLTVPKHPFIQQAKDGGEGNARAFNCVKKKFFLI